MKKYVCIATLPDREKMLEKTVNCLRSQVDYIKVALNNYDHLPAFLKEDEVVFLDNTMGDAGKYYFVKDLEGYIFTCDDDLIYPPDYVKYMIQGINRYKCPVTLHGKTYQPPIESFGKPLANYRCLDDVNQDGRVDVGGTGVMAWHSADLKVSYEDFKSKNMADIWFAKLCKEQGVKIMCLSHKKGHLAYQNPKATIWNEEENKGFKEQTKLLKSFINQNYEKSK